MSWRCCCLSLAGDSAAADGEIVAAGVAFGGWTSRLFIVVVPVLGDRRRKGRGGRARNGLNRVVGRGWAG